MSVRRLATKQPESFAFSADSLTWVDATIAKYPAGRQASAVIPMLWRAQEQEGWVSEACIRWIADRLGMAYIRVYEIATFYTMFHLAPVGKVHVQVCGTTPCMLRGAGDLIKVCKSKIAARAKQVTEDGMFSWEEVECLGACVNAPTVQIWSDTYEDLTPESFEALLDAFKRGETPKAGTQLSARKTSDPQGGVTTLSEFTKDA
jgi:NADH-quinone oxidoreductase subunit E